MALPGMRSTADFAAGEMPGNWRAGILLLSPRNDAPLYSLTAAMRTERTDSPEFNWWEEDTDMLEFEVEGAHLAADTTINLVSKATRVKPGDVMLVDRTGERVRVLTVVSDTQITVQRAVGTGGTPAGTAAALVDADFLVYIGSAYREGAPRSVGTSHNPVKKSNVTQIFRTPVEITRTAMQTTFRTGDPFANDRRRALHKHSMGLERAFLLGSRYETMENGQPLRYTGGILSFIDPENVVVADAQTSLKDLEDLMENIFSHGSSEKLTFGSLHSIMVLNRIIRYNTDYQWGPAEKEYNLNVRRLITPAGTLVLTEHPLFSASRTLKNDLLVLDTDMLRYRPLQDTTFKNNIQENGVDGKAAEFLTEAGLEVQHGKAHALIRGLGNSVAVKDNVPVEA